MTLVWNEQAGRTLTYTAPNGITRPAIIPDGARYWIAPGTEFACFRHCALIWEAWDREIGVLR